MRTLLTKLLYDIGCCTGFLHAAYSIVIFMLYLIGGCVMALNKEWKVMLDFAMLMALALVTVYLPVLIILWIVRHFVDRQMNGKPESKKTRVFMMMWCAGSTLIAGITMLPFYLGQLDSNSVTAIFPLGMIACMIFSNIMIRNISPFFIRYQYYYKAIGIIYVIHIVILAGLEVMMCFLDTKHSPHASFVIHFMYIVCFAPITFDFWICYRNGFYMGRGA